MYDECKLETILKCNVVEGTPVQCI